MLRGRELTEDVRDSVRAAVNILKGYCSPINIIVYDLRINAWLATRNITVFPSESKLVWARLAVRAIWRARRTSVFILEGSWLMHTLIQLRGCLSICQEMWDQLYVCVCVWVWEHLYCSFLSTYCGWAFLREHSLFAVLVFFVCPSTVDWLEWMLLVRPRHVFGHVTPAVSKVSLCK